MKIIKLTLLLLSCCLHTAVIASDNSTANSTDNPDSTTEYSTDVIAAFEAENMIFEELPIFFTASRLGGDIDKLAIPVQIIDSEDIHYSGATNIIDLLRYSPGIDVLQGNRNHYRMSMGGLRYSYYDRNVTLINGRSLNSPVAGGTEFAGIPIFMEDIDRIEVITGSSGASDWGSNAFTGVVNIVTKRPENITPGFMFSTTFDEYGDIYNHLRWANKKDNWQWRLSTGYDEWISSEDAVNHDNFSSNDYARNYKLDSEVIVKLSDLTELSFGAAYNRSLRGDIYQPGSTTLINPMLPTARDTQLFELSRFYARLARKKYDDFSFHIQWYGNYEIHKEFLGYTTRSLENDIEVQANYDFEHHTMILGSNFRHHSVDIADVPYSFDFSSNKYLDYQAGIFFIDRWNVTDSLNLEFQAREDYFSDIDDNDFSGLFSAVWDIDKLTNQKLKFTMGRAFRYATYGWRYLSYNTVSTNPNVKNEQVSSYQLGYSFDLAYNANFDISGYYHCYKDTIGVNVIGFDPLSGPLLQIDNNGDVDVLGVLAKLNFVFDNSDLDLWCSYEDRTLETTPMDATSIFPPRIRAGFAHRYYFSNNWTLNTNFKCADQTTMGSENIISSYNDCSVALAKRFADDNGEIMVGVQNLFDEDFNFNFLGDPEEVDEPIGRTFFARLQLKF